MNKTDLVDELALRLGSKRQAELAVETVTDLIIRWVADGKDVRVHGFGVFERANRSARRGRNPRTNADVPIPPVVVPRFRPSDTFRHYVAEPESLPRGRPAARRKPSGAMTESA
ncbi:DNA-binding protein HU-beta [Kineosphaera limosa]|uniref:DNA-binding protein Hu n=1 Tax=Kineosphaera limosa NBRC 100340 TaxID=1184609 RepID=K6WNT6_9MICO|nr:HU family DNA-binding protein [Kineosphaera limosa]NYE01352.1 DNA-binding protein HU-beta [Kineosphaera limosa]GAB95476.1 DNA-binding protein Hu [Kineosphaera limosa NBRC 100340]